MSNPRRPQLIRQREGDPGHQAKGSLGPNHPTSLPDKPSWLSPLAGEIWDEYVKFTAPGLLKLVHSMGLAQLCEDKALEIRLRGALAKCESRILEALVDGVLAHPPEPGADGGGR